MNQTKEQKNAISLNREILSNSQDINNVLTTANNVSPLVHTHYVNMASGKNGIEHLIEEILLENEALFPAGIENTALRSIAIASAMFASDIIERVQARFAAGSKRYPYATIHQYLSVFMTRNDTFCTVKVGKIALTKKEDSDRHCKCPRMKWYLLQD